MSANLVRHTVALLLILTACNLAASFGALMAARAARNDAQEKLQRIEETTAYLSATVATLCERTTTACPPR